MSGFSLPPSSSPLYEIEEADLAIVRDFFALLLVHSEGVIKGPLQEFRRHWPEAPEFPTFGHPSALLRAAGIARRGSAGESVLKALRAALDDDQAAAYLALNEQF